MKNALILLILLLSNYLCINAQQKGNTYTIRTIAFYNLENLFDTINNPDLLDELSPIMALKSNKSAVYKDKIEKLGFVISKIGKDKTKTSPAIIGVCEIENKRVLEDLTQSKHLKTYNYSIIHYNSPDKRGIDVALLYQQQYFKPVYHKNYNPNIYKNNKKVYTRDQLLVSGYLDNELIHLIVNHWPSRRGGTSSIPLREKAAYQNTKILAEIRAKEANAKVIIMGDFNDNPTDTSIKKGLNTKRKKSGLNTTDLYNPFENSYKQGYNTTVYRDKLFVFDQIIVSSSLVSKNFNTYKLFKAKIFNKQFLLDQTGKYKGYPYRSFSGGNYTGGYSDHFPVYVYLIKKVQ